MAATKTTTRTRILDLLDAYPGRWFTIQNITDILGDYDHPASPQATERAVWRLLKAQQEASVSNSDRQYRLKALQNLPIEQRHALSPDGVRLRLEIRATDRVDW